MPGLLRAAAATAVVAGTAQATRNAVNRRQADKNAKAYTEAMNSAQPQQQYAPPPQQYAPPPPPQQVAAPASGSDQIEQLERLGALKAQGLLTDEEFAAQKAKILGM
jgi:hypothetical protein